MLKEFSSPTLREDYYWYRSYMKVHHVTIEQVALSCHKWEICK